MINKMRILIYKTHLVTMKIHIENTIKYWTDTCKFTGETAIKDELLVDLKNALFECGRQIEQLSDFEIDATAQRKAHEDFAFYILKDSQNIRGLEKDKFPKDFVVGSLSIPYILDSMDKFNHEVGKLKREKLEASIIRNYLINYMEMVKNIVS